MSYADVDGLFWAGIRWKAITRTYNGRVGQHDWLWDVICNRCNRGLHIVTISTALIDDISGKDTAASTTIENNFRTKASSEVSIRACCSVDA